MADINEIVSKAGINSVVKAREEIEKTNLAIQETIVNSKSLSDTLAGAKTMGQLNKDTQALAKNQEQLLKLTAQRQLSEERLASFRAKEAQRAEREAAKRLAEEEKQIAADKRRLEILERKNRAQFQPDATVTNGATLDGGTTVTPGQIDDALAASQAAAIPAINANTEATEENAEAKKRLAFEALQAREAERQNALELRRSVREANAARGSLEQRRLALGRLQRQFDSLSEAERNSPFGQRLARTIPQLNAQVLELERSTGRAQRNVGNYGNAFTRAAGQAFNGLKQIANIIPGLGIAGLIGFAVEPIIEYVKNLDIFKKKVEDVASAGAAVSSEYKKAVTDVTALGVSIKEFQSGTITRTEVVKRFNETIGQSIGELQTYSQVEDFYNKQSANFIQATLLRAKAQAALNVVTEKNSEALVREVEGATFLDYAIGATQALFSGYAGVFGASKTVELANKRVAESAKGIRDEGELARIAYEKLQKEADEFAKRSGLNFRPVSAADQKKADELRRKAAAARIQVDIETAKEQQKIFEEQLNNENFSYENRINALNNFAERGRKIAELENKKEIAAKKLTNDEKLSLDREQSRKEGEIALDAGQKLIKINRDNAKLIEDIRVFRNEKELSELSAQRDAYLTILTKEFNERGDFSEKATEAYEKRRAEITNQYAQEEVRSLLKHTQQLIDIRKINGEDTSKDEAELASLRLRFQDLEFKEGEDRNKKRLEKEKELQQQLKQLYQETFDFARALSNGLFEGNISRLEKESEAANEKKEQDIENVNESLLSEEEKAERIAVINSQAEAKQKEIDARIAAQKRKQAVADKAFALAQIAINTAVATTKTLGQTGIFGLPLTAILIAFGALQAATVLATPIPEFRHGGTMKHDGLAQFGEVGSELRINPDGSRELTPDKTTVGFVKKGTRFITASETKRMLGKPGQLDYAGKSWDVSGLISSQNNTASRVEKAINKLTTPSTILTKHGWNSQSVKTTRLNKYLKRNLG